MANQGLENAEPGPLGLMALPLQRAQKVTHLIFFGEAECTLKEKRRSLSKSDDYNPML